MDDEIEVPDWEMKNLELASEYRTLGEELMIQALEYKAKAIRSQTAFWRGIQRENTIPKTAIMKFLPYNNKILVCKGKKGEVDESREHNLNIKMLELEIALLKKKLDK